MTDPSTTPDEELQVVAPVTPGAPAPAADAAAPQATPATPPSSTPRRRWLGICFDAFLVLLLLAVLGVAGYYFHLTTQRYHVPTPMEQMLEESAELDRRYSELLPQYNQADAQLHMRARLAQLEGQAARFSALIAEKKASIDDQHSQVLAVQYAIRQADETNRGIARSLLPGMPVGTVTTTTGKAYRDATIYRLDKRYIYIRFPEGQVRFPLSHLVKDNLPELVRYAFGNLELIDMSDFENSTDSETPAQAHGTRTQPPANAPRQQSSSYDPAPGAPVLDTNANTTTTSRVPDNGDSGRDETWEAPSGELPM